MRRAVAGMIRPEAWTSGFPRFLPRVAVLVLATSVVVLAVAVATRPPRLSGATPASGATLAVAPAAVTLTFTRPVDPRDTHVGVVDSRNTPVNGSAGTVDSATVTQPVAIRAAGTYRVRYHVTFAGGESLTGTLTFAVATDPAAGPAAAPGPVNAGDGGHGHALDPVTLVILALNSLLLGLAAAALVIRRFKRSTT